MLLDNMVSPTLIKNIKPTAITQVESIVTDLLVADKKLDVLLFPIGCKIADTSFIRRLKITISISGDNIALKISNDPTTPTEFFISTELDKIKSIPSDK